MDRDLVTQHERHAEGMSERGNSMKWLRKLGWKRTEIAFGAV